MTTMSTVNTGVQGALPIIGGLLSGHLHNFQGQMQARATLLQGGAQAFAHRQAAEAARQEAMSVKEFTEQQIFALDLNAGAAVDDLKYEYAKRGIPFSGSASASIRSTMAQVELQRSMTAEAGSRDEANLKGSATNLDFMARMTELSAKSTAKIQRHTGKIQQQQSYAGGILQGTAGGVSAYAAGR